LKFREFFNKKIYAIMIKRHLILLVILTGIMIITLFLMLMGGPKMHNNSPSVDKNLPEELIFLSMVS
jgi:hypothetical protein